MRMPRIKQLQGESFDECVRRAFRYDPQTGLVYRFDAPDAPIGNKGPDGELVYWVQDRPHRLHRIGWFLYHGRWPDGLLDHSNRDPSDNRIANLREATTRQNARNQGAKNPKSGFKGVYTSRDKWFASIRIDGGPKYLGRFNTKEDAARAYDAAALELHGEFACTNEALGLFKERRLAA